MRAGHERIHRGTCDGFSTVRPRFDRRRLGGPRKRAAGATRPATARTRRRASTRTYVLDTSVLLTDPRAFFRFAEHDVVIPVVVITELEGKRHDPEIGYFARQALRHLDELRVEHGRLDFPVPVGETAARCASS